MNASQVRAFVAAKWPEALQSPVAKAIAAGTNDKSAMFVEALRYARECIEACDIAGSEYDAETLAHNIESNFPELTLDECDDIAAQALSEAS